VTVCIAAISRRSIVTASDMKLTTGHYSVDTETFKSEAIHPDWNVMFAGKIHQRSNLVRHAISSLDPGLVYHANDVGEVLTEGYVDFQRQLAKDLVLSPYNLDIDGLIAKRQELGDALYERLMGDVARVQVGFEMLVFGFDKYEIPRVFTISNPTADNPSFVNHFSDTGFAAIGSGGYLADSQLFGASQYVATTLEETVYNVCAAKFAAESASDVGPTTYVRIFERGHVKRLNMGDIDVYLKREWAEHGRPKRTETADKIIAGAIEKASPVVVRRPGNEGNGNEQKEV
jgi:hypothetical protein